jgi:hypothetical protein
VLLAPGKPHRVGCGAQAPLGGDVVGGGVVAGGVVTGGGGVVAGGVVAGGVVVVGDDVVTVGLTVEDEGLGVALDEELGDVEGLAVDELDGLVVVELAVKQFHVPAGFSSMETPGSQAIWASCVGVATEIANAAAGVSMIAPMTMPATTSVARRGVDDLE